MNAVILKFNVAKGNYWGNEAHPNGIGLQTLCSITQAVVDVVTSKGSIYVCRVGRTPEYFGPMSCSPEIVHERGAFYRVLLTGNLVNQATGFLNGAMTYQVQQMLDSSEGVLIQGRKVRAFHFNDDQPAELKLSPPFVLMDPA
ncbi:hypothetical protein OWM54_37205 [Myxococcus sp. MISCRS1]|uniref:hypothetical protein n=1 Tax=Myxococcus sp. MISCRS1 TaxID=2996786 RepID=UPI002271E4AC|nr:hypothetical protein [Myxococcus sp. MISCRS1]MCY1002803.1 hypothetical protein [Myxococcus sp. MISCRS1]